MLKRFSLLLVVFLAAACARDVNAPVTPADAPALAGPSFDSDPNDNFHWVPALRPDHGGSHFRLGHISWRTVGPNRAEFTYVTAFRRSAFWPLNVGDVTTLASVSMGDGNWLSPTFTITFVDLTNDWFEARAVFTHQYAGPGPYNVESTGCCRIGIATTPGWAHMNNPDHSIRYHAKVDFAAAGNAASTLPPMVTCPINGPCNFNIAAGTPDGAAIRYRLATSGELGDGWSSHPPGASVNPTTGVYSWNTTGAAVWGDATRITVYSTQVVMETLDGAGNVRTKSMIDFLIRLANIAINAPPTFIAPTPADGSTFTASAGVPFSIPVAASDADAADVVTITGLGMPAGSSLSAAPGNPSTGTFTWTPTTAQAGVHIISFSATDNKGLSGGQRSIRITVPSDATPPVITPTVTGTLGGNGWYTSDVNVSWTVVDNESPISSSTGCGASTLSTDDAAETYTCSATSAGGSASASVTVKRDATVPGIAFAGNAGAYTVDQTVAITCSASDAMSGIASATCPGASGPAYGFTIGANTLNATATDHAGLSSSASETFTVQVTADGLCALVRRWVTQQGIANSLCQKLAAAAAATARGSTGAAANIMAAFVQEVQAQSGKHIAADKAAILEALALAL